MSQLDVLLSHLGLQEYIGPLLAHGFESWGHLVNINEDDMAELDFKLGDRRKLQRAIASYQGYPHDQPLLYSSTNDGLHESGGPTSSDVGQIEEEVEQPKPLKRRYRRHPPKDPHAPQRPNSAYVLFATFLRQSPQVSELPFVSISKLVGKRWGCLLPVEKAIWTSRAAEQKSRYNQELVEYQQTEDYQRHQDQLHQHINGNDGALIAQRLYEAPLRVSMMDTDQTMIPSQQRSNLALDPSTLSDDLALHIRNGDKESKGFYIQVLNPFRMISGTMIWPFLCNFLQRVNSLYYYVNTVQLVRQFNLAVDTTAGLPNHVMYTLCLCISIGCQVHDSGTGELAVMWYENGRRYLDSDDWGWNLNVMRALALISAFHSSERPTTARHYLDTALRIGEAHNLSDAADSTLSMDDTASHEWGLVWGTIQLMASTGHQYPTPS